MYIGECKNNLRTYRLFMIYYLDTKYELNILFLLHNINNEQVNFPIIYLKNCQCYIYKLKGVLVSHYI